MTDNMHGHGDGDLPRRQFPIPAATVFMIRVVPMVDDLHGYDAPWQPTWAPFASVSLAAYLDSLNRHWVSKLSRTVCRDKSQRAETPQPAKHAGLKLLEDGARA